MNENFGQGAWEKVMEGLSQEDRQLIGESILSSQWYPFEIGDHIDKAIVKVLGKGDSLVFEQLGAKSAQKSLAKEHRTFLSPGNPQSFMKKTGSIYKFYYDTGYREYQATGPNSGVITTHEAETYFHPGLPDGGGLVQGGPEDVRGQGHKNNRGGMPGYRRYGMPLPGGVEYLIIFVILGHFCT